MLAWVTEAKKEAGPDEFLWNSSDSASCFLCSFSLGHLDESGWNENICLLFSSHQESPSCPPENRPSGTRKNQASFPFHSGNPTTFSSIFNFQFSDSMTSASVSASKPLLPPSLPSFHLSLINQAFFLFSRLFSGLERSDWWLGTGMHAWVAAVKNRLRLFNSPAPQSWGD